MSGTEAQVEIVDVTSKIKEYHNSAEYGKTIQKMFKKIIKEFSTSTDLEATVEKVYAKLMSNTTFLEKLAKDMLMTSIIKSHSELVAADSVRKQIDAQVKPAVSAAISSKLASKITTAIANMTADVMADIKRNVPQIISDATGPIIMAKGNEYLSQYIMMTLPGFVQGQIDAQIMGYLGSNMQLNTQINAHVSGLLSDPQYHVLTTEYLKTVETKVFEDVDKWHAEHLARLDDQQNVFNLQLQNQRSTFNSSILGYDAVVQNLTSDLNAKMKIIRGLESDNVTLHTEIVNLGQAHYKKIEDVELNVSALKTVVFVMGLGLIGGFLWSYFGSNSVSISTPIGSIAATVPKFRVI